MIYDTQANQIGKTSQLIIDLQRKLANKNKHIEELEARLKGFKDELEAVDFLLHRYIDHVKRRASIDFLNHPDPEEILTEGERMILRGYRG